MQDDSYIWVFEEILPEKDAALFSVIGKDHTLIVTSQEFEEYIGIGMLAPLEDGLERAIKRLK